MPNSYPAECPVDANSVSCHQIGSEPIAFAWHLISLGAALLYSGNCLGELSEC